MGDAEAANLFDQALTLHLAGRLDEAAALYEEILRRDACDSSALTNFGTLQLQCNRPEAGIRLLRRSLEVDPGQANACNLLACCLKDVGCAEDALAFCDQAIRLRPDYADAFSNRGDTLMVLGQPERALADYDHAIALKQDYPETFCRRGHALFLLGRPDEALASYDRALASAPAHAEALCNRGAVLARLGRISEAMADFDRAIALRPDYAEAFNNRGNALFELGRTDEALASYDQAIALKPDYAEAFCNRGNVFLKSKQLEKACTCYDRAVALKPDHAAALVNRGTAQYYAGRPAEAQADLRRALELEPDNAVARWALALACIPAIPASDEDARRGRAGFVAELDALDAWFDAARTAQGAEAAVGNPPPFYLAYQEEDNKPLLARYGALCGRLMANWQRRHGGAPDTAAVPRERIRVGIVSNHIVDHSVWHALIKGWMRHFDRSRFELLVFHLRPERDGETALAQSLADVFVAGRFPLAQWAETILAHRADALIYPEVGMDPTTLRLACLRLAPLQLAAWGHPETTGLPTIDGFLSAEDFEPPEADANYTEKLVRLPHLGCCYSSSAMAVREEAGPQPGGDADVPLLLCAGTPYKYAPRYDRVLAGIVRRLGRCRMAFFAAPNEQVLAERLRERLRRAFSDAGLDLDACSVLVPWQDKPAFHALLRRADALLDTIGFSGFNTAMQAMECATPVVTMEGRFMRGRLASGILRRMGLDELIAADEDEYVARVVRLARDTAYRSDVKARIEGARSQLFDDQAPVRALEDFLAAQCRTGYPLPP